MHVLSSQNDTNDELLKAWSASNRDELLRQPSGFDLMGINQSLALITLGPTRWLEFHQRKNLTSANNSHSTLGIRWRGWRQCSWRQCRFRRRRSSWAWFFRAPRCSFFYSWCRRTYLSSNITTTWFNSHNKMSLTSTRSVLQFRSIFCCAQYWPLGHCEHRNSKF